MPQPKRLDPKTSNKVPGLRLNPENYLYGVREASSSPHAGTGRAASQGTQALHSTIGASIPTVTVPFFRLVGQNLWTVVLCTHSLGSETAEAVPCLPSCRTTCQQQTHISVSETAQTRPRPDLMRATNCCRGLATVVLRGKTRGCLSTAILVDFSCKPCIQRTCAKPSRRL
jgi:hypothetical protein